MGFVDTLGLSRLVAHLRIFKLFMKGKFDAYVLWPLAKWVQNWIVDLSTARDFTVSFVLCTIQRNSWKYVGEFLFKLFTVCNKCKSIFIYFVMSKNMDIVQCNGYEANKIQLTLHVVVGVGNKVIVYKLRCELFLSSRI